MNEVTLQATPSESTGPKKKVASLCWPPAEAVAILKFVKELMIAASAEQYKALVAQQPLMMRSEMRQRIEAIHVLSNLIEPKPDKLDDRLALLTPVYQVLNSNLHEWLPPSEAMRVYSDLTTALRLCLNTIV